MAMNEKMLPIGKIRTVRTGDYLYTLEVVGWNERSRCNVWAEKSKRYSPAERTVTYELMESMKSSEEYDHAWNLARKINKETESNKKNL